MKKTISVVIPVFNNSETIEKLCDDIVLLISSKFPNIFLTIVTVNDGSTDSTDEKLKTLQDKYPNIVFPITLSRNFGQLGALQAGFSVVNTDAVICISADRQDPIELMVSFIQHWLNGAEIVIAYREDRNDGFFNKISSRIAYGIAKRAYPELPNGGYDYWLMTDNVRGLLTKMKGRHNFLQGHLTSFGFNVVLLPYVREKREFGKSGYSFSKKFKILVDFVVDTSYLPIRIITIFGTLTAISGIIYSCMIIFAWYYSRTPFSGWAPLMIVNLVISGATIFILGILGEYIWRIYDNLRDFPLFIIDKNKSRLPDRKRN